MDVGNCFLNKIKKKINSMKTIFDLEELQSPKYGGCAMIIGKDAEYNPFLAIKIYGKGGRGGRSFEMADKDLERFAVNILKALKSKKISHGRK